MVAPNPTAPPLSYSKTSESMSGSAASGSAGVLGPDNIAVPSGASTAGPNGSGYLKTSETADSPYGKITEQRKSAPGAVVKQSVAVVVDSAVKGVNLTSLQQALTSAAGVDTTRGDTISVTSMPFDTTAAKAAKQQLAAAASAKSRDQFFGMIKTAAIALAGAADPRHRVPDEPQAGHDRAGDPRPRGVRERAPHPRRASRPAQPAAPGSTPCRPVPTSSGSPELVERRQAVHALVERQPDEVAELLRGWLADRRG